MKNSEFKDDAHSHALNPICAQLAPILSADPTGRGFIGAFPTQADTLCRVAAELSHNVSSAALFTGFPILAAGKVYSETDGPVGTAFLAAAFELLKLPVALFCEELHGSVVAACLRQVGASAPIVVLPTGETDDKSTTAIDAELRRRGVTHLIAVERPGLSHTPATASRMSDAGLESARDSFLQLVLPEHWNRHLNITGESLEPWVADVDSLFDATAAGNTGRISIGIGDGGNEIGMGGLAWSEVYRRLPKDSPALRTISATRCTHLITAGVTNWAAYALALLVLQAANKTLVSKFPPQLFDEALQAAVGAGAIDGLTKQTTPTNDGVSPEKNREIVLAIYATVSSAT